MPFLVYAAKIGSGSPQDDRNLASVTAGAFRVFLSFKDLIDILFLGDLFFLLKHIGSLPVTEFNVNDILTRNGHLQDDFLTFSFTQEDHTLFRNFSLKRFFVEFCLFLVHNLKELFGDASTHSSSEFPAPWEELGRFCVCDRIDEKKETKIGGMVFKLKNPPSAILGAALAEEKLSWNSSHIIIVIPRKLCTCPDMTHRKESHPRKAKIVSVHKDILHKEIRGRVFLSCFWLITLLNPFSHFNVIQFSKVFVSVILATFIGLLLSQQVPSIDTDKLPLGNVIEATQAPTSVGRLEDLKFERQWMLYHAI
uniref:Uncharacterized protein n=1 Tax=Phlebotomus papatasi TaxID=29031 RepID=A0A1B0DMP5_PHLPP